MSLRARFLCLVLLATLLPVPLVGWRFVRENNAEIAEAVKNLAMAAGNVAADLEHRVQGTAQLHYGLAHSRVLDSADPAVCSAYLSQVREAYPQYTGILTVLPGGQLHCDSLRSGRVLNLADRAYVRRAVAGETGLILEPVFGRLTGHSVLQIVWPARGEGGALRFMLVASLNLQKFAAEAQQQSLLAGSELLLVDDEGTVMAAAGVTAESLKPGRSLAGTAVFDLAKAGGTGELVAPGGQPQVWAVAQSPALRAAGLRVLLAQPRQVLVAVSKRRLMQALGFLAGAALLLFAGVWSLAEWGIRRQVVRITSMVGDLGAGKLAARIALPYPRGELGGLMAVLNRTADSLQQQRQAIEDLAARLNLAHTREIAAREQNEARLARMANYDGLTGLPNRSLFRDRLQHAMARARRTGQPLALMFLDIDRFKNINDSLGHDVGDRLLMAVAAVLAGCVRDSDSIAQGSEAAAADAVFRLGGDEFMILAEQLCAGPPQTQLLPPRGAERGRGAVPADCSSPREEPGPAGPGAACKADAVCGDRGSTSDYVGDTGAAAAIAQRILQALAGPFTVDEHELFISASIGITLHAGDGVDLDGLIKQADIAMYRSKELGRDTYCFFDETMNQAVSRRHQMEVLLRHALERNEFVLHYQPKADLATGRVVGVEALLRWQPAGQALVAPDQFISILEETGLIVPVGAWVLHEACRQVRQWQAEGMRPIRLAVNLSARQLRHQDLLGQIAAVLAHTGLDPAHLEVELTESLLIDDSEPVVRIMAGLAAMGVSIAIDDFGTGHSSLRYLKRFNVNTLKIDRAFVQDTPDDAEDSAIATAVIALGHGLGLHVVAEGVETPQQVDFLRSRGCDEFQGYLLSRPLDAEAFAGWFARHEAVVAAEAA